MRQDGGHHRVPFKGGQRFAIKRQDDSAAARRHNPVELAKGHQRRSTLPTELIPN